MMSPQTFYLENKNSLKEIAFNYALQLKKDTLKRQRDQYIKNQQDQDNQIFQQAQRDNENEKRKKQLELEKIQLNSKDSELQKIDNKLLKLKQKNKSSDTNLSNLIKNKVNQKFKQKVLNKISDDITRQDDIYNNLDKLDNVDDEANRIKKIISKRVADNQIAKNLEESDQIYENVINIIDKMLKTL